MWINWNCKELVLNKNLKCDLSLLFFPQTQFRVLPSQEYKLHYNFFPLVAGQVALPRLHLDMMRYPGTMDDIISKMLPTNIFIRVSQKFQQKSWRIKSSLLSDYLSYKSLHFMNKL